MEKAVKDCPYPPKGEACNWCDQLDATGGLFGEIILHYGSKTLCFRTLCKDCADRLYLSKGEKNSHDA